MGDLKEISDLLPVAIPDEYVRVIYVTPHLDIEKAINDVINEASVLCNVKNITSHDNCIIILFERKYR